MTTHSTAVEALAGRMFHVVGMPRAGTTFLYHNLQKHPQVFAPIRKEVCGFGHNHHKGLDWMAGLFGGLGPGQLALDACPLYFFDPRVIERIREFSADSRVILGFRDPLEWLFSLHSHYDWCYTMPPLAEFLDQFVIPVEGQEIPVALADGGIAELVEAWRRGFGDNILLFDFAVLATDPLALLRRIEEFVGLDPWFEEGNFTAKKIHSAERRMKSRLLNRFFHLPGVSTVATKVIPHRVGAALRAFLENRGQVTAPASQPAGPPAAERALVEERFSAAHAYYRELFSEQPILLG